MNDETTEAVRTVWPRWWQGGGFRNSFPATGFATEASSLTTMIYPVFRSVVGPIHGLLMIGLWFGAMPCVAAPGAERNERLQQALEKYPEADANGDGILTPREALNYRAQLEQERAGARQGRVRKQREPKTVSGQADDDGEVQGFNGLYMGHSFFRPAAFELLDVIPATNVVNHTGYIVSQGGQGGSPASLWAHPENRRKGRDHLDSGKVDLLVMTYYSPEDSAVEHYARWFDHALGKNPDMTFMIAVPWGKAPHKTGPQEWAGVEKRLETMFDSLIQPLRDKYPENRVLFCPYGLGMRELVERVHEGDLLGVKHVLDPDRARRPTSKLKKEQLVNDETGHGGELVARLSALLWLQALYGCDLSKMEGQTVEGLPDIPLNEIAVKVGKKIDPYNAVYEGK